MNDPQPKHTEGPVLFAAECGLALMQHRRSGKKFYLDLQIWHELVDGLKSGWQPERSRSE